MVTRAHRSGRRKQVEGQNFSYRKHLLEYDDVMNKQRAAVYARRREMLEGKDQSNRLLELVGDTVGRYVEDRCPERAHPDTFDIAGLHADIHTHFGTDLKQLDLDGLDRQGLADELTEEICKRYEAKAEEIGAERMRYTERMIMLQLLDQHWKDHLLSMDHLKEGIGLRGYGQKDPLVEYKKESFHMFQQMMDTLDEETLKVLFHLTVTTPDEGSPPAPQMTESAPAATNGRGSRAAPGAGCEGC